MCGWGGGFKLKKPSVGDGAGRFVEHKKACNVIDAQGTPESNFSFLCTLQTSQVHLVHKTNRPFAAWVMIR